MIKIYKIETKLDFEKVCYAALKKVFSVSLFPRILINIENPIFEKIFKKKACFQCFLCPKRNIFAKKVHFCDFDLGLFFYKNKQKTYLKVIDGNGLLAGKSVTNIFDYAIQLNIDQFKEYKKEINKIYNSLNKKKLLIENLY